MADHPRDRQSRSETRSPEPSDWQPVTPYDNEWLALPTNPPNPSLASRLNANMEATIASNPTLQSRRAQYRQRRAEARSQHLSTAQSPWKEPNSADAAVDGLTIEGRRQRAAEREHSAAEQGAGASEVEALESVGMEEARQADSAIIGRKRARSPSPPSRDASEEQGTASLLADSSPEDKELKITTAPPSPSPLNARGQRFADPFMGHVGEKSDITREEIKRRR